MKEISTKTQSKILKWALIFSFILGLFLTPFCQWFMNNFLMDFFDRNTKAFTLASIAIYIFGISLIFDVFQLINVCSAIEKGKVFSHKTALYLKNIAIMSFVDIVFFSIKFILYQTLPTLLLLFCFIILGMFSSVFSRLLKNAAEIKEENDLTV